MAIRVLIVRTGAMGDVLHAMPAVSALRAARPDWEILWAIEPRWRALLQAESWQSGRGAGMPLVDGLHEVATREWNQRGVSVATLRSVLALRRELQQQRFDLCIDMQGSIRSAVVGRMSGARRFFGREAPREGLAKFLYCERVKVQSEHVVEQGCELLGTAVGETLCPAKVALPVDAAAESWCDGVMGGNRLVLIAPTAGWGAKVWPAERYGAVAAALGRAGFAVLVNAVLVNAVLVNATGAVDPTAQAVVAASAGYAQAIPCSVGQMIALVRRASLVIAGDSGPLHLAAALERPVVGLFGPTDPARTGPYGPGKVLRHVRSVTNHARVAEAEAGLASIRVEEVVEASLDILTRQGEAGPPLRER